LPNRQIEFERKHPSVLAVLGTCRRTRSDPDIFKTHIHIRQVRQLRQTFGVMRFRGHRLRLFDFLAVLNGQIDKFHKRILQRLFFRKRRFSERDHGILIQKRIYLCRNTFTPLLKRVQLFKIHGEFGFGLSNIALRS